MKKVISLIIIIIIIFTSETASFSGSTVVSTKNIRAQSAIVIDMDTGKALWRKNSRTRMYPASTTKIMTALLAIEYCKMDDIVTIGREISFTKSDESKAKLTKGERISMGKLLKGLMLPSGADAAYSIAVYTARKVSKKPAMSERSAVKYFCKLMNKRAVKAGTRNTNFTNPDGYHSKYHYSTASDLSLIARAAMKYKKFRDVVSLQSYQIDTLKSGARNWKNTNKLLNTSSCYYYEYCTGIKTGYTSNAGFCLVTSASKGGKDIIVVTLKSGKSSVWTDSIKLLDYGLGKK